MHHFPENAGKIPLWRQITANFFDARANFFGGNLPPTWQITAILLRGRIEFG